MHVLVVTNPWQERQKGKTIYLYVWKISQEYMDQKIKSKDLDSANYIRLFLFHFHWESFLLRIKALNTAEADIRSVPPSLILVTHKPLYSIEIGEIQTWAALIKIKILYSKCIVQQTFARLIATLMVRCTLHVKQP